MSTIGSLAHNPTAARPVRRFKYGGDTNEGGAHGFSGGNSGGSSRSGSTGGGSMHQAAISQASSANHPQSSSKSTAGGSSPPMAGNATVADKQVADKYIADPNEHIANERDYWNAVSNLGKRANDYANYGNSTLDKIGNFIAGLFSVGEIDPTQQALGASVNNPNASWGVDPLGLGLSIAGTVAGLPLGSLYDVGKKVTGYEGPMIAFDGYSDQSPFSNSVVSPVVGNGGTIGSLGGGSGPSSTGKGDQSGTSGTVPVLLVPQSATPLAPTVGQTPDTPTDTTPAPTAAMAPYPYDPLKFGETIGGWNFWPNGHPVNAADGGSIKGPGDGQSDEIPALLSNNEHVIDAATVAAAGRGDSDAGHKVIEKWKHDVRKKAGYRNPKKAPIMGSIGSLARAA